MESNILDTVLVVSLSFLALSTVIFLVFFIPVLMQLTKTLESVHALLNTLKDYVNGLSFGLHNAGENLEKLGNKVKGVLAGLAAGLETGLKDLFRSKR